MKKCYMVYNAYEDDGVETYNFTCCDSHLSGWLAFANIKYCPHCGTKIDEKIGHEVVEDNREKKHKVSDWNKETCIETFVETLPDYKDEWDKTHVTRLDVDANFDQTKFSESLAEMARALAIAKQVKSNLDNGSDRYVTFAKEYRIVIEKLSGSPYRKHDVIWRKVIYSGNVEDDNLVVKNAFRRLKT